MRVPDRVPNGGSGPSGDGFELALVVIGGVVFSVVGVVWAGARLAVAATGGRISGGVTELLAVTGRLAKHPGDPAAAWGTLAVGIPGPVLYWTCTVGLLIAVVLTGFAVVRWWRGFAKPRERRLDTEVDARLAGAADVRPLVVASSVPPVGRLLLGRLAPRGPVLATEDRERHPAGRRWEHRQGDRGSVALIGPTRSGKTVLASAGIIAWDGPVIALSVKRDLYDVTAAARAKRGDLAVFDPSAVTGLPTARWTPLRAITTTSGAARAGRALAQAIPTNGVTGGDYWKAHGETLTSAYMSLAGLSVLLPMRDGQARMPLTMGRLAAWAFLHVGLHDPTVDELIRLGIADDRPLETRLLARDAMTKLQAFDGEDPKIRSSIYATARLAFDAWNEPAIAHSASLDPRAFYWSDEIWKREPVYVDLDWLMGGEPGRPRTLYMSAPSTEFKRLSPVFGGMLGDLREQLHAWDIGGRRLQQPLLIVIDEAGQLELQWFPEEVSTIAGLGGLFVTGWQSRSQITARYGDLADTVLSGHLSKIVFAGTSDLSTLDYLARIGGTLRVNVRGWSSDGRGRKTISEHAQKEDLLPPHVVRQMRRGDTVLIHGTLPPIHMRTIKWWKDKALRALVPMASRRKALPPPMDDTCPVGPIRKRATSPVLDEAVVDEQLARLPRPRNAPSAEATTSAKRPTASPPGQGTLDFTAAAVEEEPVDRNRVAGRCEKCNTRVPVGAGVNRLYGHRTIILCYPECPPGSEKDRTPGAEQVGQTGVVGHQRTADGQAEEADSTGTSS